MSVARPPDIFRAIFFIDKQPTFRAVAPAAAPAPTNSLLGKAPDKVIFDAPLVALGMPFSCFISLRAPTYLLRSTLRQTSGNTFTHPSAPVFRYTCTSSMRLSGRAQHATSKARQIILLSGGVESSTLLHVTASKEDCTITGLFCDYGQRAAQHELRACEAQCEQAHVRDLVRVDLTGVANAFQKRSKERRHMPLHHRNAVLLSVALSLAGQEDTDRISVAICKDDIKWYPSASVDFIRAFQDVGQTLDGVRIEAPLEKLTKREVIQLGETVGVPWGSTWSCMIGRGNGHCGRCVQCRARKRAFDEAGVVESEGFYMR